MVIFEVGMFSIVWWFVFSAWRAVLQNFVHLLYRPKGVEVKADTDLEGAEDARSCVNSRSERVERRVSNSRVNLAWGGAAFGPRVGRLHSRATPAGPGEGSSGWSWMPRWCMPQFPPET